MSKFDDANSDPTYIVPDEVEVTETAYVVPEEVVVPEKVEVIEEETTYRVDPTYQAEKQYIAPVAESRPFWSRFWWLIPLLGLLIALPFILRGCNRETVACSTLPAAVWTDSVQGTAVTALEQYIPAVGTNYRAQAVTALQTLCNNRLAHGTGWTANNAVENAFSAFAPGLESGAIAGIEGLVNGNTFCRCQ